MDIIGRYIFRQTAGALATILITLILIVWMATALRQISLVTSQGQSFVVFLKITMLAMPNLIAIVAPVALLISAIHTMNRLSGDSEIIVLSASGSTVWRLLKPYLALATLVAVFIIISNIFLAPYSGRLMREYVIQVRTDLISQVLQPGKFSSPEKGLTIHISGRAENGDLIGLMIHDERDESQIMTYLAEKGQIIKQDDGTALLIMQDGHIQRQNSKDADVNIVTFERYIFDLSQFGPKEGARDYKPRERYLGELLFPDPKDEYYQHHKGKFRSELHDRLSNPLYPFLFVLIVIVHLGYPRTTRDSRMQSVFTAFAVAAGARIVGLAGVNMLAKDSSGILLVWGLPVIGIVVTLIMAHYQIKPLSFPSISWPFRSRPKVARQSG